MFNYNWCERVTLRWQITQLEEEIHKDWQEKSEKLLAVAADKHARALKAVSDESEELETQVQELEKKVGVTCIP